MALSQPAVYFLLGTPGSGRREIVRDLVDNGLQPGDPVLVLLAQGELPDPAEEKLAQRPQTRVVRASWTAEKLPAVDLPAGGTVFFLADAQADVITQIESLRPWLLDRGAQLARIYTVVDCQFAEKQESLGAWYEACVHFSDVVFLTRRAGVANKWISDFLGHFEDDCSPALFLHVKKSGIENPALVLDPQPRRLSQYFDETVDFSELEIETDDEEDDGAESGVPEPEPYFERLRSGRRAKELPDVAKLLKEHGTSGR